MKLAATETGRCRACLEIANDRAIGEGWSSASDEPEINYCDAGWL